MKNYKLTNQEIKEYGLYKQQLNNYDCDILLNALKDYDIKNTTFKADLETKLYTLGLKSSEEIKQRIEDYIIYS